MEAAWNAFGKERMWKAVSGPFSAAAYRLRYAQWSYEDTAIFFDELGQRVDLGTQPPCVVVKRFRD